MYLTTSLTLFLFGSTAFASAEPAPYSYGSVTTNPSFLLSKRKDGYQPTQRKCGPGSTCATSCGAEYEKCDSTDGLLHCFDPTIRKQKCCVDGTGNACRDGYYCTSDSALQTWCCPDGMDLVTCAKKYGLTDTLISQRPTATGTGGVPSGTGISQYPYPYPNSTYSYYPTYVTGTAPIPTYYNTTVYPNATCTKSCKATSTAGGGGVTLTHTPTPVTSLPPTFTGGAGVYAVGLPGVFAAALGFALAL